MADFKFNVLVVLPERLNVVTAKLGSAAGQNYTDKDVGKAMKMGALSNYVLASDGDELEGFLDNIDQGPTANGFVVGGVQRPDTGFRVEAQVAAGVATPLVFGDLVVAGAQLALGTKGLPQVKKGTPAIWKYKVIRVYTTGAAGTTVLLERVG
jgi:hypothetical protein